MQFISITLDVEYGQSGGDSVSCNIVNIERDVSENG